MRRPIRLCLATLMCVAGLHSAAAEAESGSELGAGAATVIPQVSTRNHYISNLHDSIRPKRFGFNIFDTGYSRAEINALPAGVRALVWLGQKCPTPADDTFRARVDRLARNPRVFGYYLSDEPHIAECPGGPTALASRARYIALHSLGTQKSFIVLSDDEDFAAFRPAVTRVTLVGLDPYPCSIAHPLCDLSKINEHVNRAVSSGIALKRIVPVYQAFGQENTDSHYYNLPTRDQMNAMLTRWARLVPAPRMDYTYSWGHQRHANPTLRDSTSLKLLFKAYFAG